MLDVTDQFKAKKGNLSFFEVSSLKILYRTKPISQKKAQWEYLNRQTPEFKAQFWRWRGLYNFPFKGEMTILQVGSPSLLPNKANY